MIQDVIGRNLLAMLVASFGLLWLLCTPFVAEAVNIRDFSDTISDSRPGNDANHTLSFTLGTDVSPGGYIEVTPPDDFTILATSTFAARNVEMLVNGTPRLAAAAPSLGVDGVTITPGSPGQLRYTLNPAAGLSEGDQIQLLIGNHTSNSNVFSVAFSTSTGTTTTPADINPITNSPDVGTHQVDVRIYDGGEVADAGFLIAVVNSVGVGPGDTRETVPPVRFNGAPTSSVGGTTLSVELSLETNEFAICKYDTVASTTFAAMPNTFSNTGLIFHTQVVGVTPNTVERFYVRCIDDEGNFNIDDYLIIFTVNDLPTGTANTDGDVSGDGTGSGNDGTGDGRGSGGTTGDSSGEEPEQGGDAGTGGSGGGGGGRSGPDSEDDSGGGFESTDAPYLSGEGRVVISGSAFPNSEVVALVDGVIAERVDANSSGRYSITLDEIASGVYTFGVYGVDTRNIKSSTFSTSFTVTGALTTTLSNVNVMPSILVDPDPVNPGELLTISGYSVPNATVTIENQQDGVKQSLKTFTTTSANNGQWSIEVDTTGFRVGTYKTRAQATQSASLNTAFSNYTFYGVGEEASVSLNADLNRDGSVNLTDFSILLFWWGSDGGASNPPADINQDGNVSLTDFSILLFNWTG